MPVMEVASWAEGIEVRKEPLESFGRKSFKNLIYILDSNPNPPF